jgi:RimJ/RimL family protein N-acetyltransferase
MTEAIQTSHDELRRWMDWMTDEPRTNAQSVEFVESSEAEWDAGEAFNYVMTDPQTDEVIGICGLMTRPGPRRLEIGYWVRSDRAGAGIATAAATLLTDAGLAVDGIDIVEIHHDAANVASARIPEKLGYTEAVRREVEIDSPGECGIEVIWEITNAGRP